MPPRAYNNASRLQQQAELKSRIAAAAAELHRQRGAVSTSYADIAQQAGVSLPTVYAHFPTLNDLVRACTAHVGAQAPAPDVQAVLGAPDLAAAAAALVQASDALNAYFEPWVSWREEALVPVLAELNAATRAQQVALITAVLRQHLGEGDHKERAAVWETLLSFEVWHRLVRAHKRSRSFARDALCDLLLAVTGPRPAASPSPRPNRRKK